jgi:hypothetical protein
MNNLFPMSSSIGDEGFPAGKPVANESPVDTKEKIEKEDESEHEMQETYGAKPVLE